MAPKQQPGKSKQDYETPQPFIDAVKTMLGIEDFTIDLAADASNNKAGLFYSIEEDSLSQDWGRWSGWCWLNPPFGKIEPWAKKAQAHSYDGTKIAMLVPSAVGSNWWRYNVEVSTYQLHLSPRLSFDGIAPYPKDCSLVLYGTPFRGSSTWRWRP